MCNSDDHNANKQKYDIYFDERRALTNAINNTDQQFDKAILTLSAGALALSLTFVEKISPTPFPYTKWLLILSWCIFTISMVTTLISFITSKLACERQIEIIEDIYKNKPDIDINNKYTLITKYLNYASLTLFMIGVILLVLFSSINIEHKETIMGKDKKQIQKEHTPPKAPAIPGRGFAPPNAPLNPDGGTTPPKPPAQPPTKKK